MGNSRTGSHADGLPLFHPDHAFPPALRAAWPLIRRDLAPRRPLAAATASLAMRSAPVGRRPGLRRVLSDPVHAATLGRLARSFDVDEADVAAIAARTPGADADLVRARVRLWRSASRALERRVRKHAGTVRAATRMALRAHVLAAVARIEEGPDPRARLATWLNSEEGRRFWRRWAAPPWSSEAAAGTSLVET